MNPPRRNSFPAAKWLCALLASLVLLPAGRAQTNTGGGRWLLIFDASYSMKKSLPATEAAVKRFFSSRADGQMEDGDSVGVWTFDRQINAQFPTFTWSSEGAAESVSNLVAFLHRQSYRTEASAALLQTPLKHVVAGSRRLTVLLFTAGEGDISGTPYDPGVNRAFAENRAERKKTRQPFVVVLRSQFGKFAGCMVNFPPGNLNLPPFPPPPPPRPVAPPRPVVVAPSPPPVPALVIMGTNVSTDTNALMQPVKPVAPTNETPSPAPPKTNSPPVKAETKSVTPPTNAPVVRAAEVRESGSSAMIYFGIGILAVALVVALLIALALRLRRRPQSSLITSSMEDHSRRD